MKIILLLTFVALCYSAPRGFTRQGNVHLTEDGNIVITEPNGKQVTIKKVQDITGQSEVVVSVSGPNMRTKAVRINEQNEVKEIPSDFEEMQRDKRSNILLTNRQPDILTKIIEQEEAQNILNSVISTGQRGPLDESALEALQVLGETQGLNSLQKQNLLQKQAILEQLKQHQLLSNPMENRIKLNEVFGLEGGLEQRIQQVPVIQQVLPDGTVISQSRNGLVTISKIGVTEPLLDTQMRGFGGRLLSSGSSLSNILRGFEGQISLPQITSQVIQEERKILQNQALLQQQQLQLQQRQQLLQLQQGQQQEQQNVQQRQLIQQQLRQQQLEQQQQVLQQQEQQQQMQNRLMLQQLLKQNPMQNTLQSNILQGLTGLSRQNTFIGNQRQPIVTLTQGTSGIPLQRLV